MRDTSGSTDANGAGCSPAGNEVGKDRGRLVEDVGMTLEVFVLAEYRTRCRSIGLVIGECSQLLNNYREYNTELTRIVMVMLGRYGDNDLWMPMIVFV